MNVSASGVQVYTPQTCLAPRDTWTAPTNLGGAMVAHQLAETRQILCLGKPMAPCEDVVQVIEHGFQDSGEPHEQRNEVKGPRGKLV